MTLDSALGSRAFQTTSYTYSSLQKLSQANLEEVKSSLEKKIAEIVKRKVKSPFGDRYSAEGKLIPRPPNSFLLFTREIRAEEMSKVRKLKQKDINVNILTLGNKNLANRWRKLDDKSRLCWKLLSLQARYQTLKDNPWFKFLRAEKKSIQTSQKDKLASNDKSRNLKRANVEIEHVCPKKAKTENIKSEVSTPSLGRYAPDEDEIFSGLVSLEQLPEQKLNDQLLCILKQDDELNPLSDSSSNLSGSEEDWYSSEPTFQFDQLISDEEQEDEVNSCVMSFQQESAFPELDENRGVVGVEAYGGLCEGGLQSFSMPLSSQSIDEDAFYRSLFSSHDQAQSYSSYLLSRWDADKEPKAGEGAPNLDDIP